MSEPCPVCLARATSEPARVLLPIEGRELLVCMRCSFSIERWRKETKRGGATAGVPMRPLVCEEAVLETRHVPRAMRRRGRNSPAAPEGVSFDPVVLCRYRLACGHAVVRQRPKRLPKRMACRMCATVKKTMASLSSAKAKTTPA